MLPNSIPPFFLIEYNTNTRHDANFVSPKQISHHDFPSRSALNVTLINNNHIKRQTRRSLLRMRREKRKPKTDAVQRNKVHIQHHDNRRLNDAQIYVYVPVPVQNIFLGHSRQPAATLAKTTAAKASRRTKAANTAWMCKVEQANERRATTGFDTGRPEISLRASSHCASD